MALPILSIVGAFLIAVLFAFSLPAILTGIGLLYYEAVGADPGHRALGNRTPRFPVGHDYWGVQACGCSSARIPSACTRPPGKTIRHHREPGFLVPSHECRRLPHRISRQAPGLAPTTSEATSGPAAWARSIARRTPGSAAMSR